MKYQKFVLIIALLFVSQIWAQGWYLQTTLSGNPPVVSVKTISKNVAWIAGFNGTVYRTTDGGQTWGATPTKASTTESLGCIEALDENIAFVGGAGPDWNGGNTNIYRTTDGGQSWDTVYTAVGTGTFWDWIKFFDVQNGIAMSDPSSQGGSAVIVKTSDGGTTWTPIANPPDFNQNEAGIINSFHFYDNLNGWFGTGRPPFFPPGDAGRIFRTTDGGNTWSPFASGNGETVSSVEFVSPMVGIRTSDNPPYLTRSTDGGQTWTEVTNLPIANIQILVDAVSVTSSEISQIWISGKANNEDFIITSIDEGITWVEQQIDGEVIDPIWHMSAGTYGTNNDSVQVLGITFDVNTLGRGGQIFSYLEPLGFITEGQSVFASRLIAPIGLELDAQNNLYAAEEGTGNNDSQISMITPDGLVNPFLVGLPSAIIEGDPQGASHLYFDIDGKLLIVQGDGTDSISQSILVVDPSGFVPGSQPFDRDDIQEVHNIGQYVLGQGASSSNPYSLSIGPNDDLFIVDAGFNGIVRKERSTGNLSTFAMFDPIPNPTPVGPPMIDPVPTGSVFNGSHFYVSGFTGFPFLPGLSQIYEIDINGNVSVFKDSLTSVVDIAIDPRNNNLVALEYGVFDLDAGFLPGTGKVLELANGTVDTLISNLSFPTGLHFGSNGDLFVSTFRDGRILKFDATITDIETIAESTPNDFYLEQNYPNPFNPSTNIEFQIEDFGLVTLKVYDVLGQEFITLINEEKPAGSYKVEFDGKNLSSGIYLYTIQSGKFIQTRKMILMK